MAGWKPRLDRLEDRLNNIAHWVSVSGQAVLMVMVALTVTDIILRRVFNQPLASSLELSQIMLVVVVFTSITYCGFENGHVSIDAIVSRLPDSVQRLVDAVTGFLAVVLFTAMMWGSLILAVDKFENHSITGMLPIPLYPFVLVVSLGSFLLALVLFVRFVRSLTEVIGR